MITLSHHIEKSFSRLSSDDYGISRVFRSGEYGWPADWEGRALLAFCNLYELTGEKIPCAELMLDRLPSRLNEKGYMGRILRGKADEQQLSGHNWLLRGLCEYYKIFKDSRALSFAKQIVENLYLAVENVYPLYPTERDHNFEGGVSGSAAMEINGWILSTDVGCAYMCLDGLAEYYAVTKDERIKKTLDDFIGTFLRLDRLKMKCQTHATLSATRGILKLYAATKNEKYLRTAENVFDFYLKNGMTLTYENFNWFGRADTWTEPCCVVDSFILACELYRFTGKSVYKTLLSRIWYNGLGFCHRQNGGAGPDSCVTKNNPVLKINMYEADFCCTMRYCEGLKYASDFKGAIVTSDIISKDEYGRVYKGNEMLVEDLSGELQPTCEYKGKRLLEIPTLLDCEKDKALRLKLNCVFKF